MSDRLTRAGWPRPVINGLPIPWVSPINNLASMSAARAAACASGAICAVCGGDYQDGEAAYVLVRSEGLAPDLSTTNIRAMDNGVLHQRCLKLALKRCPELRRLRQASLLHVVRCEGNAADIDISQDDKPQAVLDGSKCQHVPIDSL